MYTHFHNITRGLDRFRAQYYEEKSVNGSQIDIKRKTCDIRTWKKHLFLNISSANNDTFVQSLYQCVETRSTDVF
jgi:hypothetical protein